jgi:adenylosuccinate lyase
MIDPLLSVSSIDGRYFEKTKILSKYFSEFALIKNRVFVELEFLSFLISQKTIPKCSTYEVEQLVRMGRQFNLNEAKKIKKIENKINHDVKAIELYLRSVFKQKKLNKLSPFIHIGLTSSDINNIAVSLSLKQSNDEIIKLKIKEVLNSVKKISLKYKNNPIIGRTHGQPAVPTTFGKEIANFYYRLKKQQIKLNKFLFEGKLNGAVGSYNALSLIYPKINWVKFSTRFLRKLKLKENLYTTQILPYDNIIEFFQILKNINNVLIGFSIDLWLYYMLGIISLEKGQEQVGSSTMPQKINPIELENAEGNLQTANALFSFYEQKLLYSRLQRDLSDSTIVRTFGTAVAHTIIGWSSILKGLSYLRLNKEKAILELEVHWEVLAEAVQTYLRSKEDDKAYEKVKDMVYGKKINKNDFQKITNLIKDKKDAKIFSKLEPKDYIGLASKLTSDIIKKSK